jgi:hypothetical protein
MNPENHLAVKGSAIVNGNLFVFSWLSFMVCWVLLKLVVEQVYVMEQARSGNLTYMTPSGRKGYPPLIPITPNRLALVGLILFSLVVLVASVRAYKHQLCSEWNRQLCKRILFCTWVSALTVIGFITAGALYFYRYYSAKASGAKTTDLIRDPKWRLLARGFHLFGWFLATGMGTFGKHAPGHSMGNFHMGLWICFGLSLYLFKKTLTEFLVYTKSGRNTNKRPERELDDQPQPSNRRSQRIPGLIQSENCHGETPDDDDLFASLRTTTGTAEDVMDSTTPTLVTRIGSGNIKDRKMSHDVSSKASRYSVAMSLEESFIGRASLDDRGITICNSEDPEEGLMTTLRKTFTEKTEDTRSSDEDDASAQTSRRGSATRSSHLSSHLVIKSPGIESQSSGDNGDFNHETVKQVSVPFGSCTDSAFEEDSQFDETERSFENHNLSCSAITTAVDNTTGDVLIDPREFKDHRLARSC